MARRVLPGQTVLITRRTLRRHLLFRPDSEVNEIFVYLVGYYVQKFHMKLSALQVMSDHIHLVVTDEEGLLPELLRELDRVLALCVKVLRAWEGPVWEPCAPSVVELVTAEAEAKQMVYTWMNPVRAGLVKLPRDWPGVKTGLAELAGRVLVAKRPSVFLNAESGRWPDDVRLELGLPPKLAALGEERARELLQAELEQQLAEARREVQAAGWKVLGPKRCLRISPYERATSWEPLRSRRPALAAGRGMREALREAIEKLREFRWRYRDALAKWRAGTRDVLFPAGTWWMVRHHGAAVALPDG